MLLFRVEVGARQSFFGVSHFASSMLLSRWKNHPDADEDDGMPSDRNSHCQPARPWPRKRVHDATRKLVADNAGNGDRGDEPAVRVERSLEGYQSVR